MPLRLGQMPADTDDLLYWHISGHTFAAKNKRLASRSIFVAELLAYSTVNLEDSCMRCPTIKIILTLFRISKSKGCIQAYGSFFLRKTERAFKQGGDSLLFENICATIVPVA